ncbi:histone acetyltransferase [Acrasis kona]|uniref:histone acetyltransferase n=1 Tax=Acrasis kona TaxID=1008807 RepID=A0AAW2ZDF8_9EUKA
MSDPKKMIKEIKDDNIKNIEVEEEGRPQTDNMIAEPTFEEEYSSNANSVIHLKLVRDREDIYNDETTFHPLYTHQIFGEDETIVGYKGLRIDVYYVASTLFPYISMKYDSQMLGRDDKDPIHILTKQKITWTTHEAIPIGHSFTNIMQEFESCFQHLNDNFTPTSLGQHVNTHEVDDRVFEVYRANIESPAAQKYHERVQTFVLFFIDASSYITDDDTRWEVFFVFEKYKNVDKVKYGFVGYTTVYPFYAYPDTTRVRISQFLILPSFQRKGIGRRLLQSVYDYGKSINCMEVCVEDPSIDFQMMRDLTDLENYKQVEKDVESVKFNEQYWKGIRSKLRINKEQIQRCYDLLMLEKIRSRKMSEEFVKNFRLFVKARLFRIFDLAHVIQDKNERIKRLDELYKEVEEEYIKILDKQ